MMTGTSISAILPLLPEIGDVQARHPGSRNRNSNAILINSAFS
jgi:hypothetical protein